MIEEVRTVSAVMAKELRTAARYPVSMFNLLILMPLYQLVLPALLLGAAFAVSGQAPGLQRLTGTGDLASWLVIGMAGSAVTVGVLWGVHQAIVTDREQGVLEHAWLSRSRREALVWGSTCTGLTLGSIGGAVLVGLAGTVSSEIHWGRLAIASSLLLAAVPGLAGIGYVSAVISLRWRNAASIIDGLGFLLTMLAGASFPLNVVPDALRVTAFALPTTWFIDLARVLALDTRPIWPIHAEVAALVTVSAAWLIGGRLLFTLVEQQRFRRGDLSHH
jgi:ABC-type multidrug transport system permease subunit